MMHKLMLHGHYILIGRRKIILAILATIFLNGCCLLCPEESGDGYSINFQNNTSDTLVISFVNPDFGAGLIEPSMIYPDTSTNAMWMYVGTKKGQNPIETFSSEYGMREIIWIYYYDNELRGIVENNIDTLITPNPSSLRIFWEGPFAHRGDSINSYFNLDSWVVDNIEKSITLTISESDYNVNQ